MKKVKKIMFLFPILISVIIVLLLCISELDGKPIEKEPKIITSSILMDTIDISELSTAEFTYNGIAQLYDGDKLRCNIRYRANVKAGIDMSMVEFIIDDEKKTVKPILPEIKITSNLVDEQSLSFIPAKVDVELRDALSACKADAEGEAAESTTLCQTAEENLKSIIEALIYPVITSNNYTVVWE